MMKSEGITKVIKLNPEGSIANNMAIHQKFVETFHSKSFWTTAVDCQIYISIRRATLLAWLQVTSYIVPQKPLVNVSIHFWVVNTVQYYCPEFFSIGCPF